ncbi:MAG TPA: sulfatase-like hydrolase/transferase, partial [Thermoanaerobaculia bacterium]|nr:sulfatase-like hydrolase/transferase [Thermoanaerobaculia bacterium]
MTPHARTCAILATLVALAACSDREQPVAAKPAERPSILLVTLDTTRADAIGAHTPSFNRIAAGGLQFRQAYSPNPQTLPSHSSMLTGLYPAGHGVHENGRTLPSSHPLAAERLRAAGYRTAAFVSAFPLARRFGLSRGFEVYDDELPRGNERSARDTTERALAYLRAAKTNEPLFVWVHYFEPHYPYEPPEAYRARYAGDPYRGEIAAMDEQLGRLVRAFTERSAKHAIVVSGDHGEGLGEHGEAQHGHLLYQGTMHVPLVIAGPDVRAGAVDTPVSIRRIFHTLLDFAALGAEHSLRDASAEVVLGEAMIPFLQFGWQPQIMAVEGRLKVIHAGALEVYDVIADPKEQRDLGASASLSRNVRKALLEYPVPAPAAVPPNLDDEARRQLASLGYITADSKPVVRKDAPRPRDMTHLFDDLERASDLFAREEYEAVVPLFERILEEDSHNLMAALRLAAAHSNLGDNERALAAFRRAESIAPDSPDVRHYLALHYARTSEWERAVPMLERIAAETPDRLPALEALAMLRERQNRLHDALQLRRRIRVLKPPSAAELARIGELAMATGDTAAAIEAFESAQRLPGFQHHLELGVLYIAARRYEDARTALDRVQPSHADYPMALFKR